MPIVVIEAVHLKMETKHLKPMKATKEAMHEVAGAIIAITFCNGCGVYSSGFLCLTGRDLLPTVSSNHGDSIVLQEW